jgi:hypothetical protein
MAAESHPFPSRTRKLSPPAPMVLGDRSPGRVGRRQISTERASACWRRLLPFRCCDWFCRRAALCPLIAPKVVPCLVLILLRRAPVPVADARTVPVRRGPAVPTVPLVRGAPVRALTVRRRAPATASRVAGRMAEPARTHLAVRQDDRLPAVGRVRTVARVPAVTPAAPRVTAARRASGAAPQVVAGLETIVDLQVRALDVLALGRVMWTVIPVLQVW